jgi:hypothetical protein
VSSVSVGASPGTGTRSTSAHPAFLTSAMIVSTINRAADGSSVIPVAIMASVLSSAKTTH